ncbi:hypothetical protein GCM10010222_74700 [Streptomyces tanashiensis]|nr:hypothetical protein GCM10010222_74700 [Streptomyces tanashiensis]
MGGKRRGEALSERAQDVGDARSQAPSAAESPPPGARPVGYLPPEQVVQSGLIVPQTDL